MGHVIKSCFASYKLIYHFIFALLILLYLNNINNNKREIRKQPKHIKNIIVAVLTLQRIFSFLSNFDIPDVPLKKSTMANGDISNKLISKIMLITCKQIYKTLIAKHTPVYLLYTLDLHNKKMILFRTKQNLSQHMLEYPWSVFLKSHLSPMEQLCIV